MIAIKIMLEYSHFIMVGVSEKDAKWMVENWDKSDSGTFAGMCLVTGSLWSVRVKSIVGIHTTDVYLLQQGYAQLESQKKQNQTSPSFPNYRGSGY